VVLADLGINKTYSIIVTKSLKSCNLLFLQQQNFFLFFVSISMHKCIYIVTNEKHNSHPLMEVVL